MKLKKIDMDYFFAIPLLPFEVEKFSLKFDEQFAYCSLNNSSENEYPEDPIYFISVYSLISSSIHKESLVVKNTIWKELRFIPFIPTRGKSSWRLIDKRTNKITLSDLPIFKISDLLTHNPPVKRRWWRLKHGGLEPGHLREECSYDEIKNLDFGYDFGEITIKMIIYIRLINEKLVEISQKLSFVEWKRLLFSILRNEECAKKSSDRELMTDIVEYYSYDFLLGILNEDEIFEV